MKFQFSTFESEGEYDYVQIEFDAIVDGDMDVNKMQSNGQPQIKGKAKAKEIIFTGLGYVEGNVETRKMEFHSRTTIKGKIKAERVLIDGKLECDGDVEIERLELKGDLILGGELKCDRNSGKGNIITKKLDVNAINLQVSNRTKIESIEANRVKLVYEIPTGIFSKLFTKDELAFVGEIDADKVALKNIKSNKVTCSKILLEGNCDIARKIKREPKFSKEN